MGSEFAGADEDQKKLYRLIRERTITSQMAAAKTLKTKAFIDISTRSEQYIATGEIVTFDGFLAAMQKRQDDTLLPNIASGDSVDLQASVATQQFSK